MADGANIVLYDRNGNPVTYEGIETVSFNTDEDGKIATYTHGTATDEVAVALDLSAGDQTVTPAETDLMKKVVIEKPETLVPENIRKGRNVGGVEGGFIGEGVSKEVELSLADGDQTVEADPDTLMSKIIIKKPESLRPENIAKNENVAGVEGTLKGGVVTKSDINFYDYDGTLVEAWTLEELAAATELPANPEHDGLTSQGWNWTLADLKATNRAMNVGQMYITDDGKTRLYIRIAAEGRMTVPLYFTQTMANGVTIDWGDGSPTQTLAGTGANNPTHTYTSIGDYVISLAPADGCTMGLGSGNNQHSAIGSGTNSVVAYCAMLQKVELGANLTSINNYVFYNCYRLTSITIPKSIKTIGYDAFYYCYSLGSIIIPDGVTSIGASAFQYCCIATTIVLPNSITTIERYAFGSCYALKNVTIPGSVTSIGESPFSSCYSLESIIIPDSVTSISNGCFSNCWALKNVIVSNGITSIPSQFVSSCYSLESIIIPDGVTFSGSMIFYNCYSLTSLTIPASAGSLGGSMFQGCKSMGEYHFKRETPPSISSSTFTGIPSDCIIYVPKGCLDAYQSATNWSTYASQMQEEPE